MIYNFKIDYPKFADIFNEGLLLAKENKEEAQEFFKQYVQYILEDNDKVNTIEEAERIAKSNFGYYAGYFNQEVCDIIYKTYQCSHPIFGDKPFSVSPEEAYQKGLERGKKTKSKFKVGDFIRSKDGKIETVVLEIDGGRYRLEDLGWQNINESEWEPWDGTTKGYEIGPEFCIDDWIVNNVGDVCQITEVDLENGYYYCTSNRYGETDGDIEMTDKSYHLWSIADARDGDILYFDDDNIVIFKDLYNSATFHSYCHIEDGKFDFSKDYLPDWWSAFGFCPATKEQCNILFSKMKEAGYEWDVEKKELIKIELTEWEPKNGDVVRLKEDNGQRWTISLSAEPDIYEKWFLSLNTKNGVAGGWVSDYLLKENYTFVNNPLEEAKEACKEEATKLSKAIAEAVEPTAWSKEDDDMLNDAICAVGAFDYYTYDDKQEIENWLKSLKDRLK